MKTASDAIQAAHDLESTVRMLQSRERAIASVIHDLQERKFRVARERHQTQAMAEASRAFARALVRVETRDGDR